VYSDYVVLIPLIPLPLPDCSCCCSCCCSIIVYVVGEYYRCSVVRCYIVVVECSLFGSLLLFVVVVGVVDCW